MRIRPRDHYPFEEDYSEESILNKSDKKLAAIEGILAPLKVKVLNAANNSLGSLSDIQLWYSQCDQPEPRSAPRIEQPDPEPQRPGRLRPPRIRQHEEEHGKGA